jgi:hypothetical protein
VSNNEQSAPTPLEELTSLLEDSHYMGCGCCADYEKRTVAVYEDGWVDEETVPREESIAKQILAAGYMKGVSQ